MTGVPMDQWQPGQNGMQGLLVCESAYGEHRITSRVVIRFRSQAEQQPIGV